MVSKGRSQALIAAERRAFSYGSPLWQFGLRRIFLVTTLVGASFGISREGGVLLGVMSASLCGFAIIVIPRLRTMVVCGGLLAISILTTVFDIVFPLISSNREATLGGGLGLIFALPLLSGDGWQRRWLAVVFYLSWLFLLPHIEWDVRKPFRRAFANIREGMKVRDVEMALRRELSGELPRHRYQRDHWFFYLSESDGPFNSEVISIDVRDDRVLSAEYHMD